MWPDANANHRHDSALTPLGRYWDDVVRGRPAVPDDLDPTLAETVQRLHARDDAAGADAIFEARLLATLEDHAESMHREMARLGDPPRFDSPLAASVRPSAVWASPPIPRRQQSRRPAWPLAQLASAALVVFALATAFVAFGPPRLGRSDDRAVGVPVVDTIFTTTLAAAQVPAASTLDLVFWRVSLESNSRGPVSVESGSCCPGAQILHVLEGDLTLRTAGSARIFRGNESASGGTVAPPYSELVLRPGDTGVLDNAMPAEYANQGSQPVQLVGSGIFPEGATGAPAGAEVLDLNEMSSVSTLPAGPLAVTLASVTLLPAGEIPSPTLGALMLAVGATKDAEIVQQQDGALRNTGVTEEAVYVLTLTPMAAADGGSEVPHP